jgi:hypothetical protein
MRLLIVLYYVINRMIERDQQRHIARDDLCRHAHGGADMRSCALIGKGNPGPALLSRHLVQ